MKSATDFSVTQVQYGQKRLVIVLFRETLNSGEIRVYWSYIYSASCLGIGFGLGSALRI